MYGYVLNDPVNLVDPDGRLLQFLPLLGPFIAAAAETGFQAALIVGSAVGLWTLADNLSASNTVGSPSTPSIDPIPQKARDLHLQPER